MTQKDLNSEIVFYVDQIIEIQKLYDQSNNKAEREQYYAALELNANALDEVIDCIGAVKIGYLIECN